MHHFTSAEAPLPRSLFNTYHVELDRFLHGTTDRGGPAFALRIVGFGLTAIGQASTSKRRLRHSLAVGDPYTTHPRLPGIFLQHRLLDRHLLCDNDDATYGSDPPKVLAFAARVGC
jgi:hypothetical protein